MATCFSPSDHHLAILRYVQCNHVVWDTIILKIIYIFDGNCKQPVYFVTQTQRDVLYKKELKRLPRFMIGPYFIRSCNFFVPRPVILLKFLYLLNRVNTSPSYSPNSLCKWSVLKAWRVPHVLLPHLPPIFLFLVSRIPIQTQMSV